MSNQTDFASDEIFTQDEFARWVFERPETDINHYELIRGRIVVTPPAGWRHGFAGARLSARLSAFVEANRLGATFDASTGFELPSGDTLEPDLAFVSTARLRALPRPIPEGFLRAVPNLVVEVLSPSRPARDRIEKREIYAQNGVEEYWIVDPARREITVHTLVERELVPTDVHRDGRFASTVLTGLEIAIDEIFVELV